MIRFSFRQLEYLTACVEERSVAAAAARLNVSQPSVSTAIAKLETTFGVQLLLRHHAQGVSPSSAAGRLIPAVHRLLAEAEALQRAALDVAGSVTGELRLGSFLSLAPTYLPGLIAALRTRYPDVSVKLDEGTQTDLIDGLRNGRHELALLYDLDLPDDLRKVRLADLQPYVLLASSHSLASRSVISLHELHSEPFILLDVPPSRSYFTSILQAAGLKVPVAYSSPSLEVVRGLVGRNLGFSILVTQPSGNTTYEGEAVAILPIVEEVAPSPVVLASLAGFRPTRTMDAFETLAIGYFSALGLGAM